ncbi:Abscisic acid 8'-hydroxylase 4 [Linum grandiflorum]
MGIVSIVFIYACLLLSSLLFYPFFLRIKHLFNMRINTKTKNKKKKNLKLPPGSMGWPYFGETLQLYSQHPNHFFSSKHKRYGEVFKTSILGCSCVMLASPEAARFVLVMNAHLFKPTYPKSKERLIGKWALFFHQGDYHSTLKKLVCASQSPDRLRHLTPRIQSLAISTLDSLVSTSTSSTIVSTFQELKKFSFDIGILAIFGELDIRYKEKLRQNYIIMEKGYNSFPTRIPGTSYHTALSARKRLGEILSEIIRERKEKKTVEKDLLAQLLNFKDDKDETLTDEQISDNIIGVVFAAQDTTASVLTWVIKFLNDDQKLFEAVKAEQMAIYQANDGGRKCLTWAQTRKMILTDRVPPEANTFMPFGSGSHSCPGTQLAKLEILIFLHHLLTKFRSVLIVDRSIKCITISKQIVV